MSAWRHKKCGTVYEIVTEQASLQCSLEPGIEHRFGGEEFVVYRDVNTGAYFVRSYQEFFDGRFEPISNARKFCRADGQERNNN